MRLIVLVLGLACGMACFAAPPRPDVTVISAPGIPAKLAGREAIFYAIELGNDTHSAWAPERADERYRPYSTFKIPNLLIALDTGTAASVDAVRRWDSARRPPAGFWPDGWRGDQTLADAFRRSTVWYFQDLALEIGGARYREMLQAFGYGNAMAPDASDVFWLSGPLEISVREQALFLRRLLSGELPLRAESVASLQEVSLLEVSNGCRLHGKTGSGPAAEDNMNGPFEGWLVGWVDCAETAPVVFALFLRGPSYASIARFRREMSRSFLRHIGAWPDGEG